MCVVVAGAIAALALATGRAGAQEPSYDELVLQALQAFDAGRWDEARRLFEQAHGLNPTARTLRTIGMAAFNQGDYVAALQNLEAALVDPRKPLTDEQRSHVSELIERANQQVGRYRLTLAPPAARLLVDGKSPVVLANGQLVLTPGRHELTASADGYQPLSRTLDVIARDRAPLELTLAPTGSAPAPEPGAPGVTPAPLPAQPTAPVASSAREPEPAPAVRDSSRTTWGLIALSIGGAGLIASGVTAGIAFRQKSDLDGACPDRRCPPEQHDRVDRYDTLRIVSTATLIAGVLGAGIGAYLLLAGGSDESAGASVQAGAGPGYVVVQGRL